MKVGIFFFHNERSAPEFVAQTARAVEERGFHAIWIPEHVLLFPEYESQYPYAQDGKLPGNPKGMIDPFTVLSFIAACTDRVRLGTAICLVPQRNPVYTAKQVADLDFLSGGRFDFGVGAGWLKEEFDALHVPFERRGARTSDYIRLMKSLWTDDVSEYEGEFWTLPPALQYPKPVQKPHPPIYFGGESDAALKRVARVGDGWMGAGVTPEDMPERLARLDTFLEAEGRSRNEMRIFVLPNRPPSGPDMFKAYEDQGVEQVIHAVGGQTLDDVRERLDRMAKTAGL